MLHPTARRRLRGQLAPETAAECRRIYDLLAVREPRQAMLDAAVRQDRAVPIRRDPQPIGTPRPAEPAPATEPVPEPPAESATGPDDPDSQQVPGQADAFRALETIVRLRKPKQVTDN